MKLKTLKKSAVFGLLIALVAAAFVVGKYSPSFWKLVSGLQRSQVEVTFHESIMKITANQGDILEVATLEADETLTRSDTKSLFDDLIYLGTTVSEIRARITYRYHIKLSEDWNITAENKTLHVTAPRIQPSLPPAIHTETMEKRSTAGWLRFNERENLDTLERSLTPMVASMSLTPAKMTLVREYARKSIADFVRTWILSRSEWKEYEIERVEINFPEEKVIP
jgi:hypothetical protein